MKLNKNNKGYRIEKKCQEELINDGYVVWKTIRHKFLMIDLWGLYDISALHSDGTHIRFIQVKSGYCKNSVKEEIRRMKMPPNCIKEVWQWFPLNNKGKRRGWLKEVIK